MPPVPISSAAPIRATTRRAENAPPSLRASISPSLIATPAASCGRRRPTPRFRNNAICLGGGRLHAIDRTPADLFAWFKRRGQKPSAKPRLVAFDLRTGAEVWHTRAEVFGTWLSYSAITTYSSSAAAFTRDTLGDEPRGMRAYGGDGKVLWYRRDYAGPAMIHGTRILPRSWRL